MGNQILQKPEPKRPNVAPSQHLIHVTLERQMNSAIKALQTARDGKNTWPITALNGYLFHLYHLVHDHHYHEEEMVFPVVKKYHADLAAPLDNFQNEHKQLSALLAQLESIHKPGQSLDVAQMQAAEQAWTAIRNLLLPHFKNEEDIITAERYNAIPIEDLQHMLDRIMKHAQSGDGATVRLSIIWYSLDVAERPVMFEKLPAIVSSVLIPWVWYSSWKEFIPFLPRYEFGQAAPSAPAASTSARGDLDLSNVSAASSPVDVIAEAIVTQKTDLQFTPEQVSSWQGEFENLMLRPTAVQALVEFAKLKGQSLERIPDDKLSTLPENVPRPRGASDFFTLTTGAKKKFFVVLADGTPYVTLVAA